MPQPDNTSWFADGWKIAQAFAGTFVAVFLGFFTWLVKREVARVDNTLQEHAGKISKLEANRVTREDLDELRTSLTATIVHGFERMESKVEARHTQNQGDVQYIRQRLDRALDARVDP